MPNPRAITKLEAKIEVMERALDRVLAAYDAAVRADPQQAETLLAAFEERLRHLPSSATPPPPQRLRLIAGGLA